MTQSIMLHHVLRTPSVLYESLQTEDQMRKYMIKQGIEATGDADFWFSQEIDRLKVMTQDMEMELRPLLLHFDIFRDAITLDDTVDRTLLQGYRDYDGCDLGHQYCRIMIDLYHVKRVLLYGTFKAVDIYGMIEKEYFLRYPDNLQAILAHAPYYNLVKGINSKTVDHAYENVVKDAFDFYRYDGNTMNGIFAKVYFLILELTALRAQMKALLYNMRIETVASVYE